MFGSGLRFARIAVLLNVCIGIGTREASGMASRDAGAPFRLFFAQASRRIKSSLKSSPKIKRTP